MEHSPQYPSITTSSDSYCHASCRYKEATSTCHAVRAGVPQGSVISPILFNFFVANYPENVEIHTTYADDVHASHSSIRPQEAADPLTQVIRDSFYV